MSLRSTLAIILAVFIGACAHQPRNLRQYDGSKVVKITDPGGTTGGTGVHVKTPSGRTYILTNRHICKHFANMPLLVTLEGESKGIPRQILQIDEAADLCIMEGLPGIEGIELATLDAVPGQQLFVLGHPMLQPLTETSGEYVARQDVELIDFMIGTKEDEARCSAPNQSKRMMQTWFGDFSACVVTMPAFATTITIFPGNSGSPVVNAKGELEGLAFAAQTDVNWCYAVPLSYIYDFLRQY